MENRLEAKLWNKIFVWTQQKVYTPLLCNDRLPSNIGVYKSLHSSSAACLESQQSQQRPPDLPGPSHLFQLIRWNPEAFPGQPRDLVPPACPGSSLGLVPVGHTQNTSPRGRPGGIPNKCPEPPQLAPSQCGGVVATLSNSSHFPWG